MNGRLMFRFVIVGAVFTVGFAVSVLSEATQAQEQHMYVSVQDENDHPVVDLTVSDFVVREDGVLREVLRVQRATEPMQVALLVDNSSAAAPYLRDLRDGLGEFVKQISGDHQVAVITFGDRPTIVKDYTRDATELQQAVGRIFPRPSSGSLLLDAIYSAAQGLERREATRPVIVAVTAAGTEYSNRPYQAVLRLIESAGATFHTVVMTTDGASFDTGSRYRDMVLDRGTERTGGRRIDLLRGQFFREALNEIAEELLSQYLLVYARPDTLVPPDEIALSTTLPSLTVRGRSVEPLQ